MGSAGPRSRITPSPKSTYRRHDAGKTLHFGEIFSSGSRSFSHWLRKQSTAGPSKPGWKVGSWVCRQPARPKEKLCLFTTLELTPQQLFGDLSAALEYRDRSAQLETHCCSPPDPQPICLQGGQANRAEYNRRMEQTIGICHPGPATPAQAKTFLSPRNLESRRSFPLAAHNTLSH